MRTLEEFQTEFFNQVVLHANATGTLLEDAFFELALGEVVEAGDIETADRAHFFTEGTRPIRVDGYGGDPGIEDGTLTLIVLDFTQSADLEALDQRRLLAAFNRLQRFLEHSLQKSFRDDLEESTPAFGLCDLIAQRWQSVRRVRMLLVTNKRLATRIDGLKAEDFDQRQVMYSVWDASRFHKLEEARGHEEIEVDFPARFGAGLPALAATVPGASYRAYLTVVPGEQLADIYNQWGARLLEQNVRAFLQARGKVNRGLKNTLEHKPEMFLAYNNGITATAKEVETETGPEGLRITKLKNLQIVNGGQTTASVHAASLRPNSNLDAVFVQMKLSVIDSAIAADVVPRIAEYANSQNKVNAADFFSNHPFHVRVEGCSRRITAPSVEGSFKRTKWFYERARGQYQDARGNLTPAKRLAFDAEYPRAQMFVKTDLAKFINTWRGLPHVVSSGAQKNFVAFAEYVAREWDRDDTQFSDQFFRDTISKAILFRRTERIVSEQPWYQGGYRANIVVYSIAKLVYDAGQRALALDLGKIWQDQALSPRVEAQLATAAKVINGVITATSGNVTEYAKREACWTRVRDADVPWPTALAQELSTAAAERARELEGKKDQVVLNGIEAQSMVIKQGGPFWQEVRDWAYDNHELTEKDSGIIRDAIGGFVSDKQALVLVTSLRRYQSRGCHLGLGLV